MWHYSYWSVVSFLLYIEISVSHGKSSFDKTLLFIFLISGQELYLIIIFYSYQLKLLFLMILTFFILTAIKVTSTTTTTTDP